MLIQLCIELLVLIFVIYYATVFLHLMGLPIFKKTEISVRLALIPFYYWIKRDVTV
jgi:hypothetical protein